MVMPSKSQQKSTLSKSTSSSSKLENKDIKEMLEGLVYALVAMNIAYWIWKIFIYKAPEIPEWIPPVL